jgi:hypothetical protein
MTKKSLANARLILLNFSNGCLVQIVVFMTVRIFIQCQAVTVRQGFRSSGRIFRVTAGQPGTPTRYPPGLLLPFSLHKNRLEEVKLFHCHF